MILNKYTEIIKDLNELLKLLNTAAEEDKQKGIKLKLQLNGLYTTAEEIKNLPLEKIDETMEGLINDMNLYKENLIDVFSALDKNNADIFMLMERLRGYAVKSVEIASLNITESLNKLNNETEESKMNTNANTNEEIKDAADAFKEEVKNAAKDNEAEKASEECSKEGITFPLWAGVAGLAGVVAISAYAGYKYGFNKGKDECPVIIINNGE